MERIYRIAIFGFLLAFSACGMWDPAGRIEVPAGSSYVRIAADSAYLQASTATMAGGILVYAIPSGPNTGAVRKIFYLGSEDNTAYRLMNNGSYRFFAIGYPSNGTGVLPKCGLGNAGAPVVLKGGNVTVNFSIGDTECSLPPFSPLKPLLPLNIVACSTLDGIPLSPLSCPDGNPSTLVGSVKVSLVRDFGLTANLPAVASGFGVCSQTSGSIATGPLVPPGLTTPSLGFPIPLRITLYSSGNTTCADTDASADGTTHDGALATRVGTFKFPAGLFAGLQLPDGTHPLNPPGYYDANGVAATSAPRSKIFLSESAMSLFLEVN